jgi:hypothetical protein
MQLRRLVITTVIAVATVSGLTACGSGRVVHEGKSEGVYVTTGGLKYQVQISRQLNPSDFEDRDFLVGLPATGKLGKGEAYFGIFMRVFNSSDATHRATSRFYLTDTTGARYEQIKLDTKINRVAFVPADLHPGDQLPLPGSLARENTTQGGLVLFRVPISAYDSRPLLLHILPEDGSEPATVTIDV